MSKELITVAYGNFSRGVLIEVYEPLFGSSVGSRFTVVRRPSPRLRAAIARYVAKA